MQRKETKNECNEIPNERVLGPKKCPQQRYIINIFFKKILYLSHFLYWIFYMFYIYSSVLSVLLKFRVHWNSEQEWLSTFVCWVFLASQHAWHDKQKALSSDDAQENIFHFIKLIFSEFNAVFKFFVYGSDLHPI